MPTSRRIEATQRGRTSNVGVRVSPADH
jgi:hypothetical protein